MGPQALKNLEISEGADGSEGAVKRLVETPRSSALVGAAVRRADVDWLIRGEAREGEEGAALRKALEDSCAARR